MDFFSVPYIKDKLSQQAKMQFRILLISDIVMSTCKMIMLTCKLPINRFRKFQDNIHVSILTGLIYVDMRNNIIGRIITIDRNNSHICINISHVDIDKFHVNINFSYTDIQVNTIILHLCDAR